jgi:hypothetical protein
MKKVTDTIFLVFLVIFVSNTAFSEEQLAIKGTVEWDTFEINAVISLDLASAGIRLPSGRTQGEAILNSGYLGLIRPGLLELQVDSSTTIRDLVDKGEMTYLDIEHLVLNAISVPPALSPDMRSIFAFYKLPVNVISTSLMRHKVPSPVARTLNPVSSAQYTGIIIIASDILPIHGMRSGTLAIPCIFPKIWDSDMNIIYERNMLENKDAPMVRYAPSESIFQKNPSGLSAELTEVVGDRPLRVFARGVFGMKPTDLIIDRSDAHLIISSRENRALLTEGRVAIILNDGVLRNEIGE